MKYRMAAARRKVGTNDGIEAAVERTLSIKRRGGTTRKAACRSKWPREHGGWSRRRKQKHTETPYKLEIG